MEAGPCQRLRDADLAHGRNQDFEAANGAREAIDGSAELQQSLLAILVQAAHPGLHGLVGDQEPLGDLVAISAGSIVRPSGRVPRGAGGTGGIGATGRELFGQVAVAIEDGRIGAEEITALLNPLVRSVSEDRLIQRILEEGLATAARTIESSRVDHRGLLELAGRLVLWRLRELSCAGARNA